MAEQLDLAAPITTPSLAFYTVRVLVFDRDRSQITIRLGGPNGERFSYTYTGSVALSLINQLNTLNMSTTSMEKRILQRLIADGILAGTVSGSPD